MLVLAECFWSCRAKKGGCFISPSALIFTVSGNGLAIESFYVSLIFIGRTKENSQTNADAKSQPAMGNGTGATSPDLTAHA